MSECLKVANGLRNRLVHHYNGLDDNIALESIRDIIPCLIELTQVMEKWLEKNK
ncbi:MAG: HepT-like ribonuclease domain-containing protein [Archaeoglobaceae archaeon]